jgi:hypothetical protein
VRLQVCPMTETEADDSVCVADDDHMNGEDADNADNADNTDNTDNTDNADNTETKTLTEEDIATLVSKAGGAGSRRPPTEAATAAAHSADGAAADTASNGEMMNTMNMKAQQDKLRALRSVAALLWDGASYDKACAEMAYLGQQIKAKRDAHRQVAMGLWRTQVRTVRLSQVMALLSVLLTASALAPIRVRQAYLRLATGVSLALVTYLMKRTMSLKPSVTVQLIELHNKAGTRYHHLRCVWAEEEQRLLQHLVSPEMHSKVGERLSSACQELDKDRPFVPPT